MVRLVTHRGGCKNKNNDKTTLQQNLLFINKICIIEEDYS